MSLPVATVPTQGSVTIATGADATSFCTAVATILTLPSGLTGPTNVRGFTVNQNTDGSISIQLNFK